MQHRSEMPEIAARATTRAGVRVLAPALIITPSGTHADCCLLIDEDGYIRELLSLEQAESRQLPIERLLRRALLAGFVNAHSHVFQRRLRGRTHRGYADHDSFWTWREQMYLEANTLTPESLYAVALSCYRE